MYILTREQVEEVRNAINNIGSLAHYARNWHKGYNTNSFTETAHNACKTLNKYGINKYTDSCLSKKQNEQLVNNYLNECLELNDILDVVYKNEWNYEKTNYYFNIILEYFKNIFDEKQRELDRKQKELKNKPLIELV